MNDIKIYPIIAAIGAAAIMIVSGFSIKAARAKVSEFGRYQGYSPAKYDGNRRISDFLTLADGTKLAYDLILPTKKGVPAGEPLPVLFKYTPYGRAWTIFDQDGKNLLAGLVDLGWEERAFLRIRYLLDKERGRLFDPLFRTKWLGTMVKHGYAVIVVDRPGTGASFGVMNQSMEAVAGEENEILDWIASQSWSNGKIGMYGESWQAMVQFVAAATGNPHLKAILPASSWLDLYDSIEFPGGVADKAFNAFFTKAVTYLENLATPVDTDKDGALLAQARRERAEALVGKLPTAITQFPFRDSATPDGENFWEHISLYPFLERVNRAGVPAYLSNGWYDVVTADVFYWYENLTVPKRLTVRPLDHSGMDETQFDLDYAAEALRWFDYWLKGIENGIMDEPPIHYYLQGVPKKRAWREAERWPLEGVKPTPFYCGQGRTGSVTSANDGFLTAVAPRAPASFDAYTVDCTTTSGKKARWTSENEPHDYGDMAANDAKALTYTTAPLAGDVEVTGHPVAHLWLSAKAADLDAFVYLEEVAPSGKSGYITEGVLRATHRRLGQAPFNNLGLPFHSHFQSDLAPLPSGEPMELVFSLLPTSYRFHKGSRIRVTIAFADADNFETPILTPAPSIHLLRDAIHPSRILLPIGGGE